MAQAATANTDELLSQLASSEIDRLLAEADGNPAPHNEKPSQDSQVANGSERAALLEAAGFESSAPAPAPPANDPPTENAPPVEDERALLSCAPPVLNHQSKWDLGRPRIPTKSPTHRNPTICLFI